MATTSGAFSGWVVPPECQGQIVEYAYGDSRDGRVWRRVTDRGDRTVTYYVADASDCGCPVECGCWEPHNREPTGYNWRECEEPVRAIEEA